MAFWDSEETKEKKRKEKEEYLAQKELERQAEHQKMIDELTSDWEAKERAREARQHERDEIFAEGRRLLYKMEYYDRVDIANDTEVERVPGGWIFYRYEWSDYDERREKLEISTFVPFAEESLETFNKLQNGDFNK